MSQNRIRERESERDPIEREVVHGSKPGWGDAFVYHVPSAEAQRAQDDMRRRFRALRDDLVRDLPQSRELSLAITHLQEAMNHAIGAIVMGDPRAEPKP